MSFIFIQIIKFYRFAISPLMGQSCRFHPTCSSYAIEALEKHGFFKGSWLGLKRILKCQPYYKGKFLDEVPLVPPSVEPQEANPIATKGRFGYKRK